MHPQAPAAPTAEATQPLHSWPELLTLPQTARALGTSAEWVAAAVSSGELPAKRFGGTWRVLRRGLPR